MLHASESWRTRLDCHPRGSKNIVGKYMPTPRGSKNRKSKIDGGTPRGSNVAENTSAKQERRRLPSSTTPHHEKESSSKSHVERMKPNATSTSATAIAAAGQRRRRELRSIDAAEPSYLSHVINFQ